MGTNYYVIKNKCECCKRYDQEYHIGKASGGWAFSFQGYTWNKLTSWKDWKEFLKDQQIVDEYGEEISYNEFVEMVETFKSPTYVNSRTGKQNLSQFEESKKNGYFDIERDWIDEQGYSFTTVEFS